MARRSLVCVVAVLLGCSFARRPTSSEALDGSVDASDGASMPDAGASDWLNGLNAAAGGASRSPDGGVETVDAGVVSDAGLDAGGASKRGPVVPQGTIIPRFPGAGTSGADVPLVDAMLCDIEQDAPIDVPDDAVVCFFGPNDPTPAATIEQVLECVDGMNVVHLRLTFNPAFVDNTYGAGSIGWEDTKKGLHTFKDLVGSDHAEIIATDGDGETVLQFQLDYISEDEDAASGYAALGVLGGDGEVLEGDPAFILDATTSLDRNLNERGLDAYTEDSPATDADYTPNPDAPEWDYRVVYEAWIDADAFGDAGFGGARVEYVHASPAKQADHTIEVEPGECPPDWGCKDPDGCEVYPPEDPPEDPPTDECPDAPDGPCGDVGDPPEDEPPLCVREPEAPECVPQ